MWRRCTQWIVLCGIENPENESGHNSAVQAAPDREHDSKMKVEGQVFIVTVSFIDDS